MRKKEANMYFIPVTLSTPPYLSSQELAQFQSEFTLFDSQLDLKKLKQSFLIFNTTVPTHQNYKPVQTFIQSISGKKEKCTFAQYVQAINQFFNKHKKADIFIDILSDNKRDLCPRVIQEILEETMGREVPQKELSEILSKVFETQNPNSSISKYQIETLFQNFNPQD